MSLEICPYCGCNFSGELVDTNQGYACRACAELIDEGKERKITFSPEIILFRVFKKKPESKSMELDFSLKQAEVGKFKCAACLDNFSNKEKVIQRGEYKGREVCADCAGRDRKHRAKEENHKFSGFGMGKKRDE